MNPKTLIWSFWLTTFVFATGATSLYVHKIVTQKGVVKGILYAMDNSSAVVDNHIVREGDQLYGVRIVDIQKFTVEFEKDGYRWSQQVRQQPDPAWQEVILLSEPP